MFMVKFKKLVWAIHFAYLPHVCCEVRPLAEVSEQSHRVTKMRNENEEIEIESSSSRSGAYKIHNNMIK